VGGGGLSGLRVSSGRSLLSRSLLLLDLGLDDRLLGRVDLEGRLGLSDLDGGLRVLVALELAPVARELEQHGDLLGRLRADGQPVRRALRVDLDERGLLGRVVLADLLDHATVALGLGVGYDDTVVGRTDLAEALETDLDSHDSPEWCGKEDERRLERGVHTRRKL